MVERYTGRANSVRKLPSTAFKKGQKRPEGAGRKPGQQNKTTTLFKDALAGSAEEMGAMEPVFRTRTYKRGKKIITETTEEILWWKPTYQGGTKGFLIWAACHYPQRYISLLGRLMPYQIDAKIENRQTVTTRFKETDLRGKSLDERMAMMREMIGLTQALPSPGMSQEGPVTDGEFTEVEG